MKVLITNAYFYRFDKKQWNFKEPYPPYGTLIAASLLKEKGYEVAFWDTCLTQSPNELEPLIKSFKPNVLVIYEDGFNYLTKMCLTVMREAAFTLAQLGAKHNCKVIMSSSDATDHAEKYLEKDVDVVIAGEAEMGLVEILEEWGNGGGVNKIKSVIFEEAGEIIRTPKRPVLRNLDELPTADWQQINFESYKKLWLTKHPHWALNIATTRGCPFKCNWCAKPIYGNRYNSRSPQLVVDEIKWLVENTGCQYFWMCDDIFGLKPGWVQEFNELVQAEKLVLKYKIQSRADLLLQEDTIDVLVESGLDEVWIGAESGSQRILDLMDKGTSINQIEESTQLLQQKGVTVAYFLQFGYMDESREEIEMTIDMLKRCMPDKIGISVSYPLPGTKFYDMVKGQMQNKFNWDDSEDFEMMYQGTFGSAFYRELYKYVHKVFNREQGLDYLKNLLGQSSKNVVNKGSFKKSVALPYFDLRARLHKAKMDRIVG